jgi:hypothetical protein
VIPKLIARFEKTDHIQTINIFNIEIMYVGAFTTNVKSQNKTPQKHINTIRNPIHSNPFICDLCSNQSFLRLSFVAHDKNDSL